MSVEIYNPSNKSDLKVEYKSTLVDMADAILEGNEVLVCIERAIGVARIDSLKLRNTLDMDIPRTDVPEDDYALAIKDYSEKDRSTLWQYRRIAIRLSLLSTLVDSKLNKKKFSFRLQKVMETILDIILSLGKEDVTLSQVVHGISSIVGVNKVVTKEGKELDSDAWINDELALQLISELAEQDYLEVKPKGKIHTVRLNGVQSEKLSKDNVAYMSSLAKFLGMSTINTSVPSVELQRTSKSSWWYVTPNLCADQLEFISVMHNIKYEFGEVTTEEMTELYRCHLKLNSLPLWAKRRVSEYMAQIKASKANGGHYISTKDDSATRCYMNGEIGHFQTSKSLRSIVRLSDVKDPVKWDFRNNVVQMYSVLMRVRNLGRYVGLTQDSDQFGDLRAILAETMNKELGVSSFNKDNTKPLFMIWAYNAGKKRLMNGVTKTETSFFTGEEYEKLKTPGLIAIAAIEDEDKVWNVWSSTLNKLVPSIVALKMLFNKLTEGNPVTEVSWTLPDGAIAQYSSAETVKKALYWVSSSYSKHTHTHYRKEIKEGAKNTGLLPRIIHSFDAYVMRQLVIRAARLGIVIVPNHDSFIFGKCHEETVFSIVDTILIELLNSNIFESVVKDLNTNKVDLTLVDGSGTVVKVTSFGDRLTAEDIIAGSAMAPEDM